MNIANFIPKGREKAIKRDDLEIATGYIDRTNREHMERSDTVIINLQDGNGYFEPLPSEREFVRHFYHQEIKRIMSSFKKLRKVKKWLKKIDGQIEMR